MNPKLTITEHAYERARERLGWKKTTLDRMVYRAYKRGVKRREAEGVVRNYLSGIKESGANNCDTLRIYGQHVFFVCRS